MFEGTGEFLKRRAAELGLDRATDLSRIQRELDRRWPGQTRAVSLQGGLLTITTPNASMASELRLSQVDLLLAFRDVECKKIRISIRD